MLLLKPEMSLFCYEAFSKLDIWIWEVSLQQWTVYQKLDGVTKRRATVKPTKLPCKLWC